MTVRPFGASQAPRASRRTAHADAPSALSHVRFTVHVTAHTSPASQPVSSVHHASTHNTQQSSATTEDGTAHNVQALSPLLVRVGTTAVGSFVGERGHAFASPSLPASHLLPTQTRGSSGEGTRSEHASVKALAGTQPAVGLAHGLVPFRFHDHLHAGGTGGGGSVLREAWAVRATMEARRRK